MVYGTNGSVGLSLIYTFKHTKILYAVESFLSGLFLMKGVFLREF